MSVAPAVIVAIAWLRLESPVDRPYRVAWVIGLALIPALVRPLAARVAAVLVCAVLAARLAFDVPFRHPQHLPGAFGSRFSNGFLDFYDVKAPFDPRVHAEMRGVILAAIFGFVLVLAFAVALRRPLVAAAVLVVGAGWPSTLRGNHGAVAIGVLILLGALVLLAGLTRRHVPRVVFPAAAALAIAAVLASSTSAVAKGGVLAWEKWDPYAPATPPVSVSFVWNAQYNGIQFPRKRTTVLEVKAPPRSLYWRAAVLDEFTGDRWLETDPLRADALVPLHDKPLLRQDVRVLALSDTHLVGATVPLRFDAGDAPIQSPEPGIATLPSGLTRGFRYSVWSFAPRPTPDELVRSKPSYPVELVEPGTFLDVWHGETVPPFGARGRSARVMRFVDGTPQLVAYAPLARAAFDVAGSARTPYGAAVALERWFRAGGGFTYTNHPVRFPTAPLVGFVTQTRSGYCQLFAGAMALMLRYLGVPARVAVGFSSGTYDARSGVWKVTDHDAHAWVEAWFAGYGWLPFDPTPAGRPERGLLSAPYAAAARDPKFQAAARAIRGLPTGDPRQSAHRHGDQKGTGVHTFGRGSNGHSGSHGISLLLLIAIVLGVVGAGIVGVKIVRQQIRYATSDPRRLAAACRQELADYLLDQRIDAARSATLHELGALVRHELAVDPDAFVGAATAARFGPPAGAADAARRARRELRLLRRRIRVRLPVGDRARGLFSLRSFGFAP